MKYQKVHPRHKRIYGLLAVIGITALLLSGHAMRVAARNSPQAKVNPGVPGLEAQCLNVDPARNAYNEQTGRVRFVGTEPGQPIKQPAALSASALPEEAARGYFSVCGSFFGLRDQSEELLLKRQQITDQGQSFVRFQQTYKGIPVLAGELIIQLDEFKNIISVSGETLSETALDTQATVEAVTSRQVALQAMTKKYQLGIDDLSATEPELWIYQPSLIRPEGGVTSLVWRMEVNSTGLAPVRELVLVDAQRGNVALSFNQVDTVKNRKTYTAGNSFTLPGSLVCNESDPKCEAGDTDAKNAHIYAGDTYDYYFNNHNRDSIDNAGMTIKSSVHYASGYCNAFWSGTQMVYGDGCFIVVDDVVGHELTHGVTDHESNLFYYYQSGAINESFSDVWGEFVDLTNGKGTDTPAVRWLVGEDTSIGAIRSMKNPPAYGDPDRMTSPKYNTVTCDNYASFCDNGGVHTNSGVNNKAAYLMTDGGSFNGQTISRLGISKVTRIYYEAQTHLLTSGADYADLYQVLHQACLNLAGTGGITTSDCQQVRNATLAVEMNKQPHFRYNPEAPLCQAGKTPINLFIDDMESGSGKWGFGALVGTKRWQFDSPYGNFAHSGQHFLYADDYPAKAADTYAAMKINITLPADAYLHFSHAFGFEGSGYDGGVVEYSTNGGGSWNDAGALFDRNGYTGKISSGSNPLDGRSAFVADSHGYISSRLNLAPLASKSIRFRWRMGLDANVFDWGWWLDDVRIYTCISTQTKSFHSQGSLDGQILESSEFSGKGGSLEVSGTTFRLGDASANRQYRTTLSFNMSGIPDEALISSAILKIKKQSLVGTDPFTTHIPLKVELNKPFFGNDIGLEVVDFQAIPDMTGIGVFNPTPSSGWYSARLQSKAYPSLIADGSVQFRLSFQLDDDNDGENDYMKFYSGEAALDSPVLVIQYYLPS